MSESEFKTERVFSETLEYKNFLLNRVNVVYHDLDHGGNGLNTLQSLEGALLPDIRAQFTPIYENLKKSHNEKLILMVKRALYRYGYEEYRGIRLEKKRLEYHGDTLYLVNPDNSCECNQTSGHAYFDRRNMESEISSNAFTMACALSRSVCGELVSLLDDFKLLMPEKKQVEKGGY